MANPPRPFGVGRWGVGRYATGSGNPPWQIAPPAEPGDWLLNTTAAGDWAPLDDCEPGTWSAVE
jgi:hypothetical protein